MNEGHHFSEAYNSNACYIVGLFELVIDCDNYYAMFTCPRVVENSAMSINTAAAVS